MNINDRVNRIEDRPVTGATVLNVDVATNSILIAYDEGGQGWWPADCLEVTPSTATLTEYPAAHDHD